MKYVQLDTRPGGIARDVAKQQIAAAKQRCGTAGKLMLTTPNKQGVYYASFSNDSHAAEFAKWCVARSVRHQVFGELPGGGRLQQDFLRSLADAIGEGAEARRRRGEPGFTNFFKQ